jgi:hypothetical protein
LSAGKGCVVVGGGALYYSLDWELIQAISLISHEPDHNRTGRPNPVSGGQTTTDGDLLGSGPRLRQQSPSMASARR